MTIYNKLVRDRILELIESQGRRCSVRVLDQAAFTMQLNKKLAEEVDEFAASNDIAELVDLLEVIQAIADHQGLSWQDLERQRRTKRRERGGFGKRLFLVNVKEE